MGAQKENTYNYDELVARGASDAVEFKQVSHIFDTHGEDLDGKAEGIAPQEEMYSTGTTAGRRRDEACDATALESKTEISDSAFPIIKNA